MEKLLDIEELQRLADEAQASGSEAVDSVTSQILRCARVGSGLAAYKGTIKHGNFQTWLHENFAKLSYETARKWMKLGKAVDSGKIDIRNAQSVRHACILANIIPETKAAGTPCGNKTCNYLVHVDRLQTELRQLDIAKLSDADRTQLIARLMPIVEFFQLLSNV